MTRCNCDRASKILAFILLACAFYFSCLVAGIVKYREGKSHPYTWDDLELTQNHTLKWCFRQSCINNSRCDGFNQVQQSSIENDVLLSINCANECYANGCNASACPQQCVSQWTYLREVASQTANDGAESKRTGTILIAFAVVTFFIILVVLVVLRKTSDVVTPNVVNVQPEIRNEGEVDTTTVSAPANKPYNFGETEERARIQIDDSSRSPV